jgi:hypothetical protein
MKFRIFRSNRDSYRGHEHSLASAALRSSVTSPATRTSWHKLHDQRSTSTCASTFQAGQGASGRCQALGDRFLEMAKDCERDRKLLGKAAFGHRVKREGRSFTCCSSTEERWAE